MNLLSETNPQFGFEQDLAEDPIAFPETVCHRTIRGDPAYYPKAEFHERTIFFCTETCQNIFLSNPERFFAAHSKRRP